MDLIGFIIQHHKIIIAGYIVGAMGVYLGQGECEDKLEGIISVILWPVYVVLLCIGMIIWLAINS